jgi:hypothetical protein
VIDSEIPIAKLPACAHGAPAWPRRSPLTFRAGRGGQLCLLLAVAACLAAGCGKKGPPLAPLLKVPVAPPDVTARRVGTAATLQFRIPAVNGDNTRPASIERVDVYGFTGTTPAPADVVKYGTLVVSIPVRLPATGEESAGDGQASGSAKPRPPASMANGFDQGDLVTVTEMLGPSQAKVVEVKRRRQPEIAAGEVWQPLLQPAPAPGGVRLYYAVGANRKGQRGAFTPPQPVPLWPAPSAPSAVDLKYDANGIQLTWSAPTDVPKPVQAPEGEGELASKPRGVRTVAGGYNVYEVTRSRAEPGPGRPPTGSGPVEAGGIPKPLNDKVLETPSFTEAQLDFGKERCFAVRTVRQIGAEVTESEPSEAACVTPADTFPPGAPANLAAVATDGAISLIWEASADADLAGYVVLRRDPAGGFVALTPEPIKETTFRDATASRGVRYVYTVVAVDAAGNRSEPSNAAEETAR